MSVEQLDRERAAERQPEDVHRLCRDRVDERSDTIREVGQGPTRGWLARRSATRRIPHRNPEGVGKVTQLPFPPSSIAPGRITSGRPEPAVRYATSMSPMRSNSISAASLNKSASRRHRSDKQRDRTRFRVKTPTLAIRPGLVGTVRVVPRRFADTSEDATRTPALTWANVVESTTPVELMGLEPTTPCMPCKCATSCATAPGRCDFSRVGSRQRIESSAIAIRITANAAPCGSNTMPNRPTPSRSIASIV